MKTHKEMTHPSQHVSDKTRCNGPMIKTKVNPYKCGRNYFIGKENPNLRKKRWKKKSLDLFNDERLERDNKGKGD